MPDYSPDRPRQSFRMYSQKERPPAMIWEKPAVPHRPFTVCICPFHQPEHDERSAGAWLFSSLRTRPWQKDRHACSAGRRRSGSGRPGAALCSSAGNTHTACFFSSVPGKNTQPVTVPLNGSAPIRYGQCRVNRLQVIVVRAAKRIRKVTSTITKAPHQKYSLLTCSLNLPAKMAV